MQKGTCVRAIGQERVRLVPEASEALRETWTRTWRTTVGSVALILRATEGSLEVLGEAFRSFSLVLCDQIWIF